MKKKLLLSVAIAAVLAGAFFEASAAGSSSWRCRRSGSSICDQTVTPEGEVIPVYGYIALPDL